MWAINGDDLDMGEQRPFVDYYQVLQVNRNCDAKQLETAYRTFAKVYHPDNVGNADVDKFSAVVEAYRILRNTQRRLEYDILHKQHVLDDDFRSPISEDIGIEEHTALTDAEAHEKILLTLYKRRRDDAHNPGVLAFYIRQYLNCPEEVFEFHAWYLKAKGFIERTEQNELAITVEGIDHVIDISRSNTAAKLRIAQSEASSAQSGNAS